MLLRGNGLSLYLETARARLLLSTTFFMSTRCLYPLPIRQSSVHRDVRANCFWISIGHICRQVQTKAESKINRKHLQQLKKQQFPSFSWQYSAGHKPPGHVQFYVSDPYHVLHNKYKKKYDNRRRDTLWWTAATGVSTSSKSTVRSYCSRKMKVAFVKALQSRGFDRDGSIPASEEYPDGRTGITGTVRILCLKPMMTVFKSILEKECQAFVDNLTELSNHAQQQKSRKCHDHESRLPYHSDLLL